jgi:hypothetical protein
LDSLLLVCTIEHKTTLTMPKGTIIYKTLIFALDFAIIVTFRKKAFIFFVINECDSDSKKWCFLLKWMVTIKMCDVTEMGMIIKGLNCSKDDIIVFDV